jgi:C-terminal processing protease CtpA/Prc
VLQYKIIEREGKKIGYLVYLQYIPSYNLTSLKTAIQYFYDNKITDLVLDLRYNPGGYTSAAQFLCSSIAPLNVVNNKNTLVTYQWNDKYQAYWASKQREDQQMVRFDATVPVKLGLNKVCILTSYNSASASELTITGLNPYMNVTLVGDTTYGKYTASFTITPDIWYENASAYTSFKNWALQPIVMRYANSLGVTDFKKGFAPNYLVKDELLPAAPLGELSEPLLRKAVEHITGVQITALKKAEVPFKYEIMDRGFSRFDEQRRNLFLDRMPGIHLTE